jgi:hypothetical protein
MLEIDHDDLRYSGQAGEQVRMTVVPQGTVPLATFTLNGTTHNVPANGVITFPLQSQPGDQPMVLQLTLDFTGQGSYRVGVRSVTNENDDECVHTWLGPPLAIKTFSFFVD